MNHSVRYFPGTAFLVVGPALAALTRDAALGQRLWPLIAQGAGGPMVLEAALQGGLQELSDLLVVQFDDRRTRVFARGSHTARVTRADGEVVACDGKGVTTWVESVFDDAQSGWVNTDSGEELPIVGGIVRADGFRFSCDSAVPFAPQHRPATAQGAALPPAPITGEAAPKPSAPVETPVGISASIPTAPDAPSSGAKRSLSETTNNM
jgi:hypothetical protein